MISDKETLLGIIERVATGTATTEDALILEGVVQRLDELDDLVDAVCSCRTQEIPIVQLRLRPAPYVDPYGDTEPGERP